MSSTRSHRGQQLGGVLAGLDDSALLTLLARGEPLATGIGGSTLRVQVEGSPVFVKQMPLSALEKSDLRSTANRFGLPAVCHYGIGSPGFGVGRELATHELTTGWVHDGACDLFPLLLHWRVLDQGCPTDTSEFEGLGMARKWGHHWPRVRDRADALRAAESSVVLFLEHVPDTLESCLRRQFATGPRAAGAAFAEALGQLINATAWMGARGLQHLDERSFFASHGHYDHDAGVTSLLHWTLAEVGVCPRADRLATLRAVAAGRGAEYLGRVRTRVSGAAESFEEHAQTAVAVTELFDRLMTDATAAGYGAPNSASAP
ncbi:protein kinase family protein [Ruania zhangjianzhongii]|uniref:protein kinase family protein n=1 Tax=Ruania zhangjianzhongii TaxID=2603206 RepID=UPI0011CAFD01|nr:protein kinase family protein [Ruania zhangjianzhongii]